MVYSNLITMKVVKYMDKAVKCAWCGEMTVPKVSHSKNDYGDIIERRLPAKEFGGTGKGACFNDKN